MSFLLPPVSCLPLPARHLLGFCYAMLLSWVWTRPRPFYVNMYDMCVAPLSASGGLRPLPPYAILCRERALRQVAGEGQDPLVSLV